MMDGDRRWCRWRQDHVAALLSLQERQREYHRAVTARALGPLAPGEARLTEAERLSLEALDEARVQLDLVRSREPKE
jgi:hypothetical protein